MLEKPLADLMRPTTIDDVIGQEHILGDGKLLTRMIKADKLSSIIFYGPPATGKTTIAKVIANTTQSDFQQINAVAAGKADMKKVVESAIKNKEENNIKTILFIDEIHRFNKAQQDYLLPYVENGTIILIGATTENPYFEINHALLSRSRIFELKPLSKENIRTICNRSIDYIKTHEQIDISIEEDAITFLCTFSNGDARFAINAIELAYLTTNPTNNQIIITNKIIQNCTQKKIMRMDKMGDQWYDMISAMIESWKHSDVNATLSYLALIKESGQDPKYVARRLFVSSYHDISLARPEAITIAASTFYAVTVIGEPECWDALAMCAIYLATCPKSHSATDAFNDAKADINRLGTITIPAMLQDASYKSAYKLGRGVGLTDVFKSEFNYDGQDCLPIELEDADYYTPSNIGYENQIKQYIDWCENYKKTHNIPPSNK